MDALEALDAASRCDLDAYSKPQLRQLVAKAHELAARATIEIDARGCAFPARLAPLVTQWLPLEDVGAAFLHKVRLRGEFTNDAPLYNRLVELWGLPRHLWQQNKPRASQELEQLPP